jgi:hypothetical protein
MWSVAAASLWHATPRLASFPRGGSERIGCIAPTTSNEEVLAAEVGQGSDEDATIGAGQWDRMLSCCGLLTRSGFGAD